MSDSIKHLTIDQLHPSPDNVRSNIGDVSELADSILTYGLLQPIRAQKNGDGYVIVAGARRHAAITSLIESKQLDADWKIPTVVQRQHDDADRTAMMLIENLQRADLTPIDEMNGYVRLSAEHGWTAQEISTATGVPVGTVRSRTSWAKLPQHILDHIASHEGYITIANKLARFSGEDIASLTEKSKVPTTYDLDNAERARARRTLERKAVTALQQAGMIVVDKLTLELIRGCRPEDVISELGGNAGEARAAWWALVDGETETLTIREPRITMWESSDIEKLPTFLAAIPSGSIAMVEMATYVVNVHAFLLVDVDAEDEEVDEVPDDETDDQRAYREAKERFEAANDEHRATVKAMERDYVVNTKPGQLVAALLMHSITRYFRPEDVSSKRAAEMLEIEPTELIDFASRNSTNLARVAAAISVCDYTGIDVPDLPERPSWVDFDPSPAEDPDAQAESEEELAAMEQVRAEHEQYLRDNDLDDAE